MPDGGRLTLRTARLTIAADAADPHGRHAPGAYVEILVIDTGLGLPAEVAAPPFEPFFPNHRGGPGSGLGISMVYGFVSQSGGHASTERAPAPGPQSTERRR